MNFIVVQRAVYNHNIYGPCDSLDSAKELALKKIKSEDDHHHQMVVLKAENEEYISVGAYIREDKCSWDKDGRNKKISNSTIKWTHDVNTDLER